VAILVSARSTPALEIPLPREHGAWGLLLQPFVAGAVLAGTASWHLLPALLLVTLGFTIREPLVVIARQLFVWRQRQPHTVPAIRWLALELLLLLACAFTLRNAVPPRLLASLLLAGALLTLGVIWVTIRNRQRGVLFQAGSAVALGASAPFAVLVARGHLPPWVWPLWAILSLHGIASILVVHTRLQARTASRGGPPPAPRNGPLLLQSLQLLPAAALALLDPLLLLPPLFSLLANLLELLRLRRPAALSEPLVRVGLRTLALSIAHLLVTIACLWPAARS
jgi:hypothetical protein